MQRTIVSLAVLKVTYEQAGRDHLDVYLPFVLQLIKEKRYSTISMNERSELAQGILDRYGLRIPLLAVDVLLGRATKRRYLTRSHGAFTPDYTKIDSADFEAKSREQQGRISGLVALLIAFAEERHGLSMTEDDAESALLNFLRTQDVELIISDKRISVLPSIRHSESCEYLARQFIIHCYVNDQGAYRALVDLAVGHMIASTILYDDFSRFVGKFRGNRVYLDAPLLLHVIGADGLERQEATRELVEVLAAQGAVLCAFESSVHEATRILRRAQRALEAGTYDPQAHQGAALRNFRRNRTTVAEVQSYIDTIEDHLKSEGVTVVEDPDLMAHRQMLMSVERLEEGIMRVYNRDDAERAEDPLLDIPRMVQRDARVLASVYLLRKNLEPMSLASAKHLLVTENSALVFADRQFAKRELEYQSDISAAQTDSVVCTVAWLQSPLSTDSLNAKRLIADVFASIDPNPELVSMYLEAIDNEVAQGHFTEDQAIVLRGSLAAYDLLQARTLNDPSRFTARTPEEVLDALLAHERADADVRVAEQLSAHEETRRKLAKQLDETESVRRQAQQEVEKNRRTRNRIESFSESVGDRLGLLVAGLATILYLWGWILSFKRDQSGWQLWLLGYYQIAGVSFSIGGGYLIRIRQRVQDWVKRSLFKRFSIEED